MKYFTTVIALFFLIFSFTIKSFAEEKLTISTYEYDLKKYQLFLAEKNTSPLEIRDFSSSHCSRAIVNLILLQQALQLGGGKYTIELIATPNPSRAVNFVRTGTAVILGEDMWDSIFDESVYMSSEVIGTGKFEKVIVGRLNNSRLMQVKNINDLRELSVVTGHDWTIDIQTLEDMKIQYINKVPLYSLQFKMLAAGRVDFALFEASSIEDKNKAELQKFNLGVVPGIKIGLAGSRHYMVSKKHPQGKQVFETLERGLKILREKGRIKKAMTDVGFYNEKISNWKKLYPLE